MNHFFNYSRLIASLRSRSKRGNAINVYEEVVGPLCQVPITEEIWYKELVKPFRAFDAFVKPEEFENEFNWGLLAQLAACSISCEVGFNYQEGKVHMIIHVHNSNRTVVKSLDELWFFQVSRLHQIFIEEQINLCRLSYENEQERRAIHQLKKVMIDKWNYRIEEICLKNTMP